MTRHNLNHRSGRISSFYSPCVTALNPGGPRSQLGECLTRPVSKLRKLRLWLNLSGNHLGSESPADVDQSYVKSLKGLWKDVPADTSVSVCIGSSC